MDEEREGPFGGRRRQSGGRFGVDDGSAPPNAPPETFRVKKNQALLRGARAP